MAEIVGMTLHIINIILVLALLYIYLQNYRQLKTKLTGGLVLFAAFFLAQGLMNLYFDVSMIMYQSASAEMASMVLEIIKAVGFAVLVWVSWE